MRLRKKYLLPLGFLFFFLAGIAFASSSQFLTQAQKYIDDNCGKKNISDQTALLCYLFNTSQEHDTSIANINATISPIPSEITDLQNRVSALETQIPTPTPAPKTFTFFNGTISTSGATSPTFDTQGGYSKIQVTYQCSVGSVPIDIQASTDGNTWTSQENFPASYCLGGVETSLVLVGRYYRVVTGSTTDPSVSLTATGYIH